MKLKEKQGVILIFKKETSGKTTKQERLSRTMVEK